MEVFVRFLFQYFSITHTDHYPIALFFLYRKYKFTAVKTSNPTKFYFAFADEGLMKTKSDNGRFLPVVTLKVRAISSTLLACILQGLIKGVESLCQLRNHQVINKEAI